MNTMKKLPGAAESERCARLREAMGFTGHGSQSSFAEFIGVGATRWNNVEAGVPLSKHLALTLVAKCPGMTLDWLFLGQIGGLTLICLSGWKAWTDRNIRRAISHETPQPG